MPNGDHDIEAEAREIRAHERWMHRADRRIRRNILREILGSTAERARRQRRRQPHASTATIIKEEMARAKRRLQTEIEALLNEFEAAEKEAASVRRPRRRGRATSSLPPSASAR